MIAYLVVCKVVFVHVFYEGCLSVCSRVGSVARDRLWRIGLDAKLKRLHAPRRGWKASKCKAVHTHFQCNGSEIYGVGCVMPRRWKSSVDSTP
jgi:hypothetical protein